MHIYGTSSGGIRAAAFAQAQPDSVDRLVLTAFTYKGAGAEEIARRQKRIAEFRANPRSKRDAEMIRSIFTRDGHPAAPIRRCRRPDHRGEQFGDTIPTGTTWTWRRTCRSSIRTRWQPVLMMRGVWDGNSTNEDLLDFFRQLPNADRQYVILPNTAHSTGYGKNRHLLWYAVQNFLPRPRRSRCRNAQDDGGPS